jgi:hypothetical protein
MMRRLTLGAALLLAGCAKRPPEAAGDVQTDLAAEAEHAAELVNAYHKGQLEPVSIPPDLQDAVVANVWMARTLYQMDQATARATDVLAPMMELDTEDRWAGVYFARLAWDGDDDAECCYEVHFPAMLEGEPAQWLHAKAGWYADGRSAFDPNLTYTDGEGQPVDLGNISSANPPDTLKPGLPEPVPYDASMTRRARLLLDAVGSIDSPLPWNRYNTLVLALADYGGDESVFIFLVPATNDPDLMLMSGWLWWMVDADSDDIGEPILLGEAPIVQSSQPAEEDHEMMGLFISSHLFPSPTVAHIFASHMYELPVWVSTDQGMWWIEGDEVLLLERYEQ